MSDQDIELIRTGFLIHDVSRLRHKVFDRQVRHLTGITRPQWWLLICLSRDKGPGMNQVDIAHLLDVGKVPLGKMLDRLERVGLVSRAPAAGDRRAKLVRLSAKGRKLIARMHGVALDLSRQIMQEIPLHRQRELNELLRQMKRNLKTLDAGPREKAPRPAGKRRKGAAPE